MTNFIIKIIPGLERVANTNARVHTMVTAWQAVSHQGLMFFFFFYIEMRFQRLFFPPSYFTDFSQTQNRCGRINGLPGPTVLIQRLEVFSLFRIVIRVFFFSHAGGLCIFAPSLGWGWVAILNDTSMFACRWLQTFSVLDVDKYLNNV